VEICVQRRLAVLPFLLALACASNVGSAATLIGNPQNMLVGQSLQLSFAGGESVKGRSPNPIMDGARSGARLEPVNELRPDRDGRVARLVRDGIVRSARGVTCRIADELPSAVCRPTKERAGCSISGRRCRMTALITPDRKVVLLRDDGTWKYASAAGSTLERLKTLSVPPAVAETVKGMFSQLGVRVIDTGEAFTCIHRGDSVEFMSGVNERTVDFTVQVYQFQLERLAEYIRKGTIDEVEQFRIACALFATAAGSRHIMNNPLMSNGVLRRMIRGKNLMHVTLVSPDAAQEPDVVYTIIFINGEQVVVPGLHGTPLRILRVPVADAITLQKNLFAGMKAGAAPAKWIKIAKWYVEWRKRVEVTS
jgi:hypothetical protein